MKHKKIVLSEREVENIVYVLRKASKSYNRSYRKNLHSRDFELFFDCDWVVNKLLVSDFID